jgi:hypothetical protein
MINLLIIILSFIINKVICKYNVSILFFIYIYLPYDLSYELLNHNPHQFQVVAL